MLFSKHLFEMANLIQGLSEVEREMMIDKVVVTDNPGENLLELLLDETIRSRVLSC